MDGQVGALAAFLPWLLAVAVCGLGLGAALSARAAARQSQAAAQDVERAAASLIQLHRDTERLQAALRDDLAAARSGRTANGPAPIPAAPTVATAQPPSRPAPAAVEEVSPDEATMMVSRPALAAQARDQFHGMPVLRATVGADQGQEFKLPFERCTMGRASNNRVVLAEAKASRVHAEVRFENHRFILKDAGSTNGTLRNGQPVTEDVLAFGDVITIGQTDLLFTCEGFDVKDSEPGRAIAAFERLLEREPDFVPALQILAFLLERDPARRRDAEGVWKHLQRLGA